MLKYLRTLRERYRYARKQRAWERSPRRAELDAESDLPPRPLTEQEAQLLRCVLNRGTNFAQSFLPQLDGMRAVRSCTCGCPSIRLAVAEDVPLGQVRPGSQVSDLLGYTAKRELVGIILWQSGGKLSELEIYSMDGQIDQNGIEFGLPVPESLQDFQGFQAQT